MIIKFAINNLGFIGKGNSLPWKCREDLAEFKKATEGQVVVMGRKTFESLGKPLPKRMNIVISGNAEYVENMNRKYVEQSGILFVKGLAEGLQMAGYFAMRYDNELCKVFVIGGASIIEQILKYHGDEIERIELSVINDNTFGDTCVSEVLLNRYLSRTFYQWYDPD